jgi:hypothetical protein
LSDRNGPEHNKLLEQAIQIVSLLQSVQFMPIKHCVQQRLVEFLQRGAGLFDFINLKLSGLPLQQSGAASAAPCWAVDLAASHVLQ